MRPFLYLADNRNVPWNPLPVRAGRFVMSLKRSTGFFIEGGEGMYATKYHMRRLGKLLKRGDAWIEGKVSGGQRWPDLPHYWVVTDATRQEVYHVPVDERPSWGKYARAMKENG